MKVRDIMTHTPATVSPGDTIATAAREMRAGSLALLPVVADAQSMRLVGLISERDIVTRCVAEGHAASCRVGAHMTGLPLRSVAAGDDAAEVARKMRRAQLGAMPVVDHGRLVGVVTSANLATFSRSQEIRLLEDTLASVARQVAHA
jgi:CBS domain-containing protein